MMRKEADMRGSVLLWTLLGTAVCCSAAAAGFYLTYKDDPRYAVPLNFFESRPPDVEFVSHPPGLGIDPAKVTLKLSDKGAGLDEVIVRSEQGGDREIYRKSYARPQFEDTVSFTVSGKELKLVEGAFALNVAVFDRSFWSNARRSSIELKVDYVKPKIEVLSVQHNVVAGGSELAFYRIQDDGPPGSSGVKAGAHTFHGYPANTIDPVFDSFPNVYFAFFSLPLGYDDGGHPPVVFAEDEVGNRAEATFYYHVQKIRQVKRQNDLSEPFALSRVPELFEKYAEIVKRAGKTVHEESPEGQAKTVNTSYRHAVERFLREFTAKRSAVALKDRFFVKPLNGTARSDFGEQRTVFYHGSDLGSFVNPGVDFSAASRSPIVAANSGKVVFAGDLGTYGDTVVIDHGFGLHTVYGHLSSIVVEKDAAVNKGEVIGRSGQTGFAQDDRVSFEIRLEGVPVRPVEWMDRRWVSDHIERKLEDVKQMFGVSAAQSGDAESLPAE